MSTTTEKPDKAAKRFAEIGLQFKCPDIIRVEVGRQSEAYYLHKTLLTEKSTFFRAALSNGFQETITQVVKLPDDDAAVFAKFSELIYGSTSFLQGITPNQGALLIRLWVMADKLGAPTLQNIVMRALYQKGGREGSPLFTAPAGAVQFVYKNSTEKSPLRRLMLEMFASHDASEFFLKPENYEKWPVEFLRELCAEQMRIRFKVHGYRLQHFNTTVAIDELLVSEETK